MMIIIVSFKLIFISSLIMSSSINMSVIMIAALLQNLISIHDFISISFLLIDSSIIIIDAFLRNLMQSLIHLFYIFMLYL